MKSCMLIILIVTLKQFLFVDEAYAQKIYLDSISVITDSTISDSINISSIVSKQIAEALLKQQEQIQNVVVEQDTVTEKTEEQKDSLNIAIVPASDIIKQNAATDNGLLKTESENESGIDFRIAVLSSAVLLAAGIVSIRRIKLSRKSLKGLKNNINLMREEKIVKPADKKLSQLRSKLKKSTEQLGSLDEAVSLTAKNLNIAKGELMLAAKIKSFELSQSCSPRQ